MRGIPPWLVVNLFNLHLTRYAAFFHTPSRTTIDRNSFQFAPHDLHFQIMQSIFAYMQSSNAHLLADTVTVNSMMPNPEYANLWDSIIVESPIKDRLLRSAALSLQLRNHLPFETTALHGLILLHGPPGTGKTTLGRGLAHQLVPITKGQQVRLIEINPHGLMSAEHGQSQKNITELLTEYVPSLCCDNTPTVVLLDEVESIAVARSEASLAANPADVHRATDAVLAALDSNTSNFTNLIFVATSNFVNALDNAFSSRVDTLIYVPTPNSDAIVEILKHILLGMSHVYKPLGQLAQNPQLSQVAQKLEGSDGRRIRKTVIEAMLKRLDTVLDPGSVTIDDLLSASIPEIQTVSNHEHNLEN